MFFLSKLSSFPQSHFLLFSLLLSILLLNISLVSGESLKSTSREKQTIEINKNTHDFLDVHRFKRQLNLAVNPLYTNPQLNDLISLGGLPAPKQIEHNNYLLSQWIGKKLAESVIQNLLGGFGGSSDVFGQSLKRNDLLEKIIFNRLANINTGIPLTNRNNIPTLGTNLLRNDAGDLNNMAWFLPLPLNSKINGLNKNNLDVPSPLVSNLGVIPRSNYLLGDSNVPPKIAYGNKDLSQIFNMLGAAGGINV